MAKCVAGNSLQVLIGSIWNDIFHQLPLKQRVGGWKNKCYYSFCDRLWEFLLFVSCLDDSLACNVSSPDIRTISGWHKLLTWIMFYI